MGDGLKLMKLLESLSGEKLGKPAKGTSRIKRIENVSRCLMFLHSKKVRNLITYISNWYNNNNRAGWFKCICNSLKLTKLLELSTGDKLKKFAKEKSRNKGI